MNTAGIESGLPEWTITNEVPGPLRTLADIWTFRRFLTFLAVRTLRKMTRRTILGWLWLFIIPLFPLALRTLIFGGLLGVTSEGIPYFLFLTVGQLLWDFLALGLTWGTRGLELHGGLEEVHVPRVIMPLGAMAPAFLDLLIKIVVLALVLVFFTVRDGRSYLVVGPSLLLVAAAFAVTLVFAMGITLFTSVWSEQTRDTRFALGQLLAIWYLVTPVLYPMSSVPPEWRSWLVANPPAAIVNVFKYGLLGIGEPDLAMFGWAALISCGVFVAGIRFFARRDAAVRDSR